jgi:hypothetical protein
LAAAGCGKLASRASGCTTAPGAGSAAVVSGTPSGTGLVKRHAVAPQMPPRCVEGATRSVTAWAGRAARIFRALSGSERGEARRWLHPDSAFEPVLWR